MLLGTGMRGVSAVELAGQVLQAAGGLPGLARALPRELMSVAGIGEARAARVAAAFHLGRRVLEVQRPAGEVVRSPRDVFERLRSRMHGLQQEIFVVLALDARNTVLGEIEVARGCLTGVDVHPREVFRPLVRMAAAGAILAHNHPSGDPKPSWEDVQLTERLCAGGGLMGIPVLDHIVIGAQSYVSLLEWSPGP